MTLGPGGSGRKSRNPCNNHFECVPLSKPSCRDDGSDTSPVDTQTMSNNADMIPSGRTSPAHITVVDSAGCHFCADADTALTELAHEFNLDVVHVPMTSEPGMQLMQDHGAGMSPLVLLDGRFVSAGRLSRGRLRTMLTDSGYTATKVAS